MHYYFQLSKYSSIESMDENNSFRDSNVNDFDNSNFLIPISRDD